jgi:hypothetical protein
MMAPVYGTDKIVLYGGIYRYDRWYNDTWVYDKSDNTWTEKFPVNSPGNRSESSMVTIWGTDKVMMFGGGNSSSLNNDTWIYDLSDNNWTRKNPTNQPVKVTSPSMASFYCTDKVILFGGYTQPFKHLNETWIYDLSENNWTNITNDPTPNANSFYEMSFIYNTDKVVLFGGKYWAQPSNNKNLTWIFDLSAKKWINIKPKNSPKPREDLSMAPIYGTDKILIFGGHSYVGNQPFDNNETWVYDLSENTWTEMFPDNPPHWRQVPEMASVFDTNKIIMFGGSTSYHFNDTWEFKLNNYYFEGNYISPPYHIGPTVTYKTISWNGSVDTNTSIKFQLRTANSMFELNSQPFVGFDGSPDSYYTISPSSTWPGHNNHSLMQYIAYLSTSNYNETPILRNVSFIYNYWPNTTLIDPNYGSLRADNRPTFEWNFTDRDSKSQDAFQIIIDDEYGFQSIDHDSGVQFGNTNTWQFPNSTSYTELSDGTWYWKARTKDNDGDWGLFSEPWRFTIDTNAPKSIITNPLDNRFYNNLTTVSGIAYDSIDGTGLNRIEITIKSVSDNSYWTGSKWVLSETWLSTSGTSKWFYDLSSIILYSGFKYNIRSRAIDNAANIEIPNKGITFIIDLDNVTFSNHLPPFNEESPYEEVTVSISISDQISGVNGSTIEYSTSKDDGKTWTTWNLVPGLKNGKTVNITLDLTFPNGTENRIKWRASDIAGNGPTESKAYTIKINTGLQRFIPRVRLLSPQNGAVVPTTSVKLNWLLENANILGVSYDLYFDTNPPIKPNITGLANLSFELNDLIDGETYYWMVIPRIDSEEGLCTSGIWSFTIDTSVPFPTVKLLRPENGSIVNSTKPTLTWAVEYYGTQGLSYDVYLYSHEELISYEVSFNRYYLPSILLQDNQTYYWKVVPKAGNIVGLESETWSFTVMKDYVPHFELELKVEPDGIVMEPASIKVIRAFVTNKGELTDRISLSIEIPFDSDMGGMVNEPNIMDTESGETANFSFILTTTQNIEAGEVIITVTATSGEALDFGIDYEEEVKVKVIIFVEEEPKPEKVSEWLFFWSILIIIIVIILALLILIFFRRKKQAQEALPEEKIDTSESLTLSTEQTQETTQELEVPSPQIPQEEHSIEE